MKGPVSVLYSIASVVADSALVVAVSSGSGGENRWLYKNLEKKAK